MDVAKLYMNNDYSEEHEHEHEDEDDEMMKEEKEVVLPGFRFHPTDEELVGFYLRRKVEKKPLKIELIKHVDIYKYDPWDLPKVGSSMGEKEWYFFCIRGRKYRNSIRPNRVTGSGFWKATGIDKPIYSANYNYNNNSSNNNNNNNSKEHGDHHECIGLKKSLVYYRGSAGKGTKTDWMMHEFRLPPNNTNGAKLLSNNQEANNATKDLHEAEVWTLCRIFKRIPTYKKYTPNLKDSSTSPLMNKPINNINHQTDSSVTSISCSLESDNNNSKPFLTFTNTMTMGIQQCERKPLVIGHVDERNNNFFLDHSSIHHQQAPTTITTTALSSSSYSSWNQHHLVEDYLFANENWDDLRSVVEFATDPNNSKVYL